MKMLDLYMQVDEKNDKVGKLKGERMDLQENLKLVQEYINNYYQDLEQKEKEKRKQESNWNGGDA